MEQSVGFWWRHFGFAQINTRKPWDKQQHCCFTTTCRKIDVRRRSVPRRSWSRGEKGGDARRKGQPNSPTRTLAQRLNHLYHGCCRRCNRDNDSSNRPPAAGRNREPTSKRSPATSTLATMWRSRRMARLWRRPPRKTAPEAGPASLRGNGAAWSLLGSPLEAQAANDRAGYSIAVSADGRTVAIGAIQNKNDGAFTGKGYARVYAYDPNSGDWTQVGSNVEGAALGDWAGVSVALSSDAGILAVGAQASDENGDDSGSVRVYRYDNESDDWVLLGTAIFGEAAGDEFGRHIALSADGYTLAATGHKNDHQGGTDSGHVRVFRYDDDASGDWTQLGNEINGEQENERFGGMIAISQNGAIVAIGAPNYGSNMGVESGRISVYRLLTADDGEWTQMGDDILGKEAGEKTGQAVALSANGQIVAFGARANNDNTGHARVYQFFELDNAWVQLGDDLEGKGEEERFGFAVSLAADGSTVAAGGTGPSDGVARVYSIDPSCVTPVPNPPPPVPAPTPVPNPPPPVPAPMPAPNPPPPVPDPMPVPNPPPPAPAPTPEPAAASPIGLPTENPPSAPQLPVEPNPTPGTSPTTNGTAVNVRVEDISIEFVGVERLGLQETVEFESISKGWFEKFFDSQRDSVGAHDLITSFQVRDQAVVLTNEEEKRSVNTIFYDQTVSYVAQSHALKPEEYIRQPFSNSDANAEYAALLAEGIPAFSNVETPIALPQVPSGDGDDKISTALVAGIAVAAVVVLIVAGLVTKRYWTKPKRRSPNVEDASSFSGPAVPRTVITTRTPQVSSTTTLSTRTRGSSTVVAVPLGARGSPPPDSPISRSPQEPPGTIPMAHAVALNSAPKAVLPQFKDQAQGTTMSGNKGGGGGTTAETTLWHWTAQHRKLSFHNLRTRLRAP